ncbi:MAG: histidine phosphatase family protein [Nannocystis sp.]|nr:histidine phosphatase family protein [Nannocystis sp.]MBA3548683.1 histidine phosphatase family protein [Nannocystis sp.]
MTTLLLIRHGQASLGAADYDVLSPLGIVQAQRLGDYLAGMIDPPDQIISGPRRRQRDTASHLVAAARARGADFPDPGERPEFDEYPALEVVQGHLQRLAAEDPELAAHTQEALEHPPGSHPHRRAFEGIFQRMMRHWHDERVVDPELETNHAFQARVQRGLESLLGGRGQTTLVVTSAGPCGVGLRLGLGLDPWAALQASFVVSNSSITELRSRGGPPSLTMFNALPHLRAPGEITLR